MASRPVESERGAMREDMPTDRTATSVVLEELLREAPADRVSLAWIVGELRERSFGVVMLLLALVGLVPGIASVAGLLLALPAFQMLRARAAPELPAFLGRRRVPTRRLAALIRRLVPALRWLERLVRPRWTLPFEATKRVVGLVILLLSATLLAPIPFSQVIPSLAIMLLAVAFLEEDGLLLCVALVGALASLAVTAATIWGAIEAGLLL